MSQRSTDDGVKHLAVVLVGLLDHDRQHQRYQRAQDGRAIGDLGPVELAVPSRTAVDQLVDAVESGEVDLAVGPDRPHGDNVRRDTVIDSLWVLWCSPTHPLAARAALTWADLRETDLVAAGRDHERSVARMHLNAPEGERIRPVDVVDNITTALGMAAEGLAATLAPAYVGVLAEHFGLVSRRVTEPETIRQVCLYHSTTRSLTPAAEAFREFAAERLQALSIVSASTTVE